MSREEILEKVIDLFSTMTEAEEITEDSEIIDDLEITSMDIMLLITSMEEIFGIKIPEKALRKMVTIGDVADVIADRL